MVYPYVSAHILTCLSVHAMRLSVASERAIVIYSVSDPSRWQHMNEVSQLNSGRTFLRTQLNDEIYDLQWSPDSSCLILGE